MIITMSNSEEIILKLISLKPKLEKDYGVLSIGIFGSLLTQNFSTKSDIDILVEFSKPIGWKVFTMEIELERIFQRKIDLVTKDALKTHIKQSILNSVKYL